GMLRERRLDFVVGRVPSSIFGEDLVSELLFDDSLHVVAGVNSPWSRRRRIDLAELCGEPWLMPESDSLPLPLISQRFRAACLPLPATQVVSNSVTLRLRLIETGRFLAILPNSTLQFATTRMQIKTLPVRLRINAPPTVAITLKNRTPNPIVRLFVDELRAFAKPLTKGRSVGPRRY